MYQFLAEQAPPIMLLVVLMAFMALGDFLTKRTKALVPAIFVMVLAMAIAGWTGLIPTDIMQRVGFAGPMAAIASSLIIVAMGTSLRIRDITANWRIALLGIVALVGVALGTLTVGRALFGWDMAVVGAPVVGGGIVATLEMQAAAANLEHPRSELLSSLAALILAVQSLPAFMIIPPILKSAMRKDLAQAQPDEIYAADGNIEGIDDTRPTVLPDDYWSPATIILALGIVGTIAFFVNRFLQGFMGNFAIATSVIALLLAIVLTQLRILPRNADTKAGISGFIFLIVIFSAFSSVLAIDFHQFLSLLGPVVGMIFTGILGILLTTYLVGKYVFKMDGGFAFVLGLNCLLGFPINYLLTVESIDAVAGGDEQARAYLTSRFVPPMLVAGFVTITIGSVFLAGIMRGFL